jgi:hypothetical protein
MDRLIEKQKSVLDQSKRFSVAIYFIVQLVVLMAGYQILTTEEMSEAGIQHDYHRSDETL